MNIPDLPTLAAGQVVDADDLNNIGSACTFLLQRPMARIHDTVGGATFNTSLATTPTFNVKDFDTDGIWSNSQASRLTINTPGWYKVRYSIQVASSASAALNYYSHVRGKTAASNSPNPLGNNAVIGTALPGYGYQISTGMTTYMGASGLFPFYLYSGDYLQLWTKASTAAGKTGIDAGMPYSNFSIELVST